MDYHIRKVRDTDASGIISLFNYYIEHGFAAYPEQRLDEKMFFMFREVVNEYPFYVIEAKNNQVIGFGFLHRYNPFEMFNRVAEVTYFIHPDYTGKGLGTVLLNRLIEDAKKMNIETLLANISSKNEVSIEFHKKNGFKECGRFVKIGKKHGEEFDVVWMQRVI
jgi:phosphinothricin acetyltransferase